MSNQSPPEFFPFHREVRAFQQSELDLIRETQRQFVSSQIPEENTHRYQHGDRWLHPANPEIEPGNVRQMSVETSIKFDDVISGDITTVPKTVASVLEGMQRQFYEMLYQTISDSCDRTGNTVDSKEHGGSFAKGFLESFRRIELGVDRQGNVTMPEIHVGGDAAKLIRQLEEQPPEFHSEFERLKAEKQQAALEREALRKSKFLKASSS
jgi:hypothetical protein